jgi:hypothetical protein
LKYRNQSLVSPAVTAINRKKQNFNLSVDFLSAGGEFSATLLMQKTLAHASRSARPPTDLVQ